MKKSLFLKRVLFWAAIVILSILRFKIPKNASNWYVAGVIMISVITIIMLLQKAKKESNKLLIVFTSSMGITLFGIAFWMLPDDCAHGLQGLMLVPGIAGTILLQLGYCKATGKPPLIMPSMYKKQKLQEG